MSVLFGDIEIGHDYFFCGLKRASDGVRLGIEFSRRNRDFDRDRLKKILLNNTIVGFNFEGYDGPLIWYAIEGASNAELKAKSDAIIQGRVRRWEVEELLGIKIPWRIRQNWIDLIEPQPNAIASLKTLNARLHGKRLQDLPFDPDARLTDEQIDESNDYCLVSDLDATENLYNALIEPLELRVALGEEYGEDFRSKSDSQIGEAIVKKRVEQLTGARPQKVETKPGTTFRYPIPPYMRFETPELQAIVERLRTTDFVVKDDGKVDLPKWLDGQTVTLGSSTYAMGIGGLHSTESNRAIHADDEHSLKDFDVAAYYPSIILKSGLYPKAVGKSFLEVYRKIRDDRIVAKHKAQEIKKQLSSLNESANRADLERELARQKVMDAGGKIQINGVFGKLGSRYSILYAPHLMLTVTITGQLALLMLVERAEAAGISVVSGNTDGVIFRCPRHLEGRLSEIAKQWESDTGFDLEETRYASVYSQSVNSYFAIKEDGSAKIKGPLGNPWREGDVRAQLMKNPQATICSDAALALIKDGTPIENTIYGCTDIRQFVTVIKSTTGATWRGGYLGKVVRYYWSTDGDEILKAKPHDKTGNYAKVPKTEGAAPCMTLPDTLPDDICYGRYIRETREILMDLGFTERPPEPPKIVRFTKANTAPILMTWALAA